MEPGRHYWWHIIRLSLLYVNHFSVCCMLCFLASSFWCSFCLLGDLSARHQLVKCRHRICYFFSLKHELVHTCSSVDACCWSCSLSLFSVSSAPPSFLCVSCVRRHAGLDAKRSLASVWAENCAQTFDQRLPNQWEQPWTNPDIFMDVLHLGHLRALLLRT